MMIKKRIIPITFAILLLSIKLSAFAYNFPANTQYDVCFTPYQNCSKRIVQLINKAKISIYLQAYSFTSRSIAHALVYAHKRGVKVLAILDKSNFLCQQFSFGSYLTRHGIPVWNDNRLRIAHNKVMIFDKSIVETGSFNFTKAAQFNNAENVLIIHNKKLARMYLNNWYRRQKVSKPVNNDPCPAVHYW